MKINLPDFSSQKYLFDYLIKHEAEIVDLKKSEIKQADSVDFNYTERSETFKSAVGVSRANDTETEINRTIVGNTYLWMDSHDDVHLENIFSNSIKQKTAARINHLHDHKNQLDARIGKFSKVYEPNLAWTDLGVNRPGETQALLADSAIKSALNKKIFGMYKADEIDQHSVGMRYITVDLALNDPNSPKQYALWSSILPKMGNPERATKKGYFWAVKEAALSEISAVLNGSNEITQTLPGPEKSTQNKTEPPADRSTEVKSDYFYQL